MDTVTVNRESKSTVIVKAFLWVALAEFVVIAIWAMTTGGKPLEGMGQLMSFPYGVAATGDLMLGLFGFAVFIFLNEDSKKTAALWTLALFMTGNPASILYLILNYSKLKAKLKG